MVRIMVRIISYLSLFNFIFSINYFIITLIINAYILNFRVSSININQILRCFSKTTFIKIKTPDYQIDSQVFYFIILKRNSNNINL